MESHCLLLDTPALTPSGLLPSTLLLEAASATSISRRLQMEVWFGRVILTAATLLMETVLVLLLRMIAGDRSLRLPVADRKLYSSSRRIYSDCWSFLPIKLPDSMQRTRVEDQ